MVTNTKAKRQELKNPIIMKDKKGDRILFQA